MPSWISSRTPSKAYEIEDKINASMVKMFDELEKEYA